MKAERQNRSNLVYWPPCDPKTNKIKMSPISKNDELSNNWQQHMRAVATQKDKGAFQALFVHFSPKIKAFYLSNGMASLSEELTQEVFIKIWQKASYYNPQKAQVSTWIFTIVRNLRIDYLRKNSIDEISDENTIEQSDEIQLDNQLAGNKQKQDIRSNLHKLNFEQRNVIQKVYFEDKSHQIAAAELEMTPGVVKSRIRSALQILRAEMGGK